LGQMRISNWKFEISETAGTQAKPFRRRGALTASVGGNFGCPDGSFVSAIADFKCEMSLLTPLFGERETEYSEQQKALLLAGESSLAVTKRCQASALQRTGAGKWNASRTATFSVSEADRRLRRR
jgi:hypothetical protein